MGEQDRPDVDTTDRETERKRNEGRGILAALGIGLGTLLIVIMPVTLAVVLGLLFFLGRGCE